MKKEKKATINNEVTQHQVEIIWKYLFLEPQKAEIRKAIAKVDMAVFGFHSSIFNIGPRIQCDTFLQIAPKYFFAAELTGEILGHNPTLYIELDNSPKAVCLKRIFVKKERKLKAEPFFMVFLGSFRELIMISKYVNMQIEKEIVKSDLEDLLMNIDGVGSKKAHAIMSTYTPDMLNDAARRDNKKMFLSIPGIRPKIAQSIIEVLKEKALRIHK